MSSAVDHTTRVLVESSASVEFVQYIQEGFMS